MKKKIAVVLSGCGFLDGAEITEAVSTLISLSEAGAEAVCFAPNVDFDAASHASAGGSAIGSSLAAKRNAIQEAGRIARTKVFDLKSLNETEFDAIVFPGGYGAAKNLSNWAEKGSQAKVHADVERAIKAFRKSDKPMGFICIAPTLAAKVFGGNHVELTIGSDRETAQEIEKTGARHVQCPVDDYVSDRDHKILSTPAYMYEAKPHEVFTGIRKMIRELVEMA